MSTRDLVGACHCGNVHFDVAWPHLEPAIAVRECGCDFCQLHGGVWTSDPQADLVIRIRDSGQVSNYQFGTRTAIFHVCKKCGVVPVVTSEIDGRLYAVINANCLALGNDLALSLSHADFEGERVADRLARRRDKWIANVRFAEVPH